LLGRSSWPIRHKTDFFSGRSLPFVFDNFTLVGAVDVDTSTGDRLVNSPDSREISYADPLYAASMITRSATGDHAAPTPAQGKMSAVGQS
jgi:hypothetical protein